MNYCLALNALFYCVDIFRFVSFVVVSWGNKRRLRVLPVFFSIDPAQHSRHRKYVYIVTDGSLMINFIRFFVVVAQRRLLRLLQIYGIQFRLTQSCKYVASVASTQHTRLCRPERNNTTSSCHMEFIKRITWTSGQKTKRSMHKARISYPTND